MGLLDLNKLMKSRLLSDRICPASSALHLINNNLLCLKGKPYWFIVLLFEQSINHVYYETEFRTEWCRTNSTFVPCFLFARKFSRGAAMRLLGDGAFGPFDATTVLGTQE